MSANPILQVKEVSKKYDAEAILDQLSFEVQKGEFLVIVGESGTGKSSLLRIMAGYLDADSGEVVFDGETLEGPAARLVPGYEEIQLVHQQFDLHPYMSAEDNIKRPLLSFTKDFQNEKLDELLKLSGLEDKRKKKPYELSGGQQQKLAISTALAVEPAILLMDEPFSNLDPFSKQVFLRQIKEQTQLLGTTAVFVTHDTRDALAVADRIIVLSEGKIAQVGTPQEVYNQPGNAAIAKFFGPINVFEPEEWIGIFGGKQSASSIGIRPEKISLVRSNDGVAGIVEAIFFHGPTTYLQVRMSGKSDLIEVISNSQAPKVGAQVNLKVDAASIVRF
ncbi:MAG: ABC transporter ATP-binding protein [Cytophagales bacterium]|nr:ABC transporter ATP-binding protein [Cytophagales bacterium]